MGWQIKTRETKKHGVQYKIWTTVSDGYITDKWMSKEEIIKFLFWQRFRKFAEGFMEDAITFPHGYTNKDTDKRITEKEKNEEWFKFIMDALKDDSEDKFYNKFFELLNESGINIDVNDGNYQVTNK